MSDVLSGMPNTVGALLPALISVGVVIARRARNDLRPIELLWFAVVSFALSTVLTRSSITLDEISLHIVPVATVIVCYLVWRGHYISPGFAFVSTYVTLLPVDFVMAWTIVGPEFTVESIGGGGWRDGLLVFPVLAALTVAYANWRMSNNGVGQMRTVRP